ncbi:MAG: DUF4468 domain-containing protein [Saprospiraceae bacterium]|nr:DUF4468 domain-containing protein [Bacteroidia bacterium]NNE16553.1 DUF4468 domain-containing protein [Saprospiraceae bacterium]NNL93774.1 DUF4468 domain-containing protein [Saprospiraceae bacterium]
MNKFLMLAVASIFMTSCAVTHFESPKDTIEVIELNDTKDKLYIKANEWMVTTFGSAKSVIQFSDKDEGIIKGKYLMKEGQARTQYVPETKDYFAIITIRVKENASKIEISPVGKFYSQKMYGKELGFTPLMFNTSADAIIDEFETYMKKESSDW